MNNYFHFYYSPMGWIRLSSDAFGLKSLTFVAEGEKEDSSDVPEILSQTLFQLTEYFEGKRFRFNLNLNPEGTPFQQQVWDLVGQVNFGETTTYGEIARKLGSSNFSRAVGLANGMNPLPIIIPCHRIIGSNGKLTGYSGGLERKKWLILHEQKCLGKLLL